MRSTLIIIVLITIKFVYCAHFSFSDNVENAENKARSDHYEKFIGNPKKYKASIKELVDAKYKKRCDTCRESSRCKVHGKCDLCTRICKDVDLTTLPPPTFAPLLGNIQAYLEDETPTTEQSGRYNTIEAFGFAPKQNLIARLTNAAKRKHSILAKPKVGSSGDPERPGKVWNNFDGNALQNPIDLDSASKIDQELDAAPQQNFVELGSRFNLMTPPHITTKRSVSNWSEEKRAFKPNKRTATANPNGIVGSPREGNEYFNPEGIDDAEDVGQDLLEYEPDQHYSLPQSASQHLDPSQDLQPEADEALDQGDVIVTLTQAPETYSNESDPIVGSNWFSDELDKAKHWWKENVGMEPPTNQTIDENKINLINATHFTAILKNLEDKVENIADLVKKTCGTKEDSNLGQEAPKDLELESRNPIHEIQVVDAPEERVVTTRPNILDNAMKDLNQGADYLINKAVNIADRLEKIPFGHKRIANKPFLEAAPARPIVGQANADRKIFETDAVGCKENSDEYLGESPPKVEDPTVACSKEDSEEYVGDKLQKDSAKSETKAAPTNVEHAQEEVGCKEDSEEYIGAPPKTDTDKESVACSKESDEYLEKSEPKDLNIPSTAQEESKISSNPEEVGESKKEHSDAGEKVGCSKEEDEEYLVPVYKPQGYNPYRESDAPKSDLLPKLPHLPTLNELLHPKHSVRDGSLLNPLKKHSKLPSLNLFNHKDAPEAANHKNFSEEEPTNPNLKHSKSNPSGLFNHEDTHRPKFPEEQPINPNFDTERELNPLQKHSKSDSSRLFNRGGAHAAAYRPNFAEEQPSNMDQFVPNQNFNEPINPDFNMDQSIRNQRIDNIPNFPALDRDGSKPTLHQRFGENQDALRRDEVVGVKKDLDGPKANTINPFTFFGKIVPQLNNTEGTFQHLPSEKIYFVGTGIHLPLNMKQDKDGAYQLSVDMDQLCSKCKEGSCKNKKIEEEVAEEPNDRVGIEPPKEEKDEFHVDLSPHEDVNQHVTNRSEIIPTNGAKDSKNIKDGHERKHIKRSPSFESSLTNPIGPNAAVPGNALQVDASLKKIDEDMKRYFDRRQKLDDFYKDQVRRSLENPEEGKDIVKRRVKLVNNVLTWMKSIAVQKPPLST